MSLQPKRYWNYDRLDNIPVLPLPPPATHNRISKEFFSQGDSWASDPDDPGDGNPQAESTRSSMAPVATQIERASRRHSLRVMTGCVLAAAVVLAASGAVRSALAQRGASQRYGAEVAAAARSRPAPASVHATVFTKAESQVASTQYRPQTASTATEAKSDAVQDDSSDRASIDATRGALRLLDQGKYQDARHVAELAVVLQPDDAYPYLYLGTALQMLGKWKEAMQVYSQCVHAARRGPVSECRAVGGH
jgi:tetratricopeptide (TPR) repeat protein